MSWSSEGVRRLAILCGAIAALLVLLSVLFSPYRPSAGEFFVVIIASAVVFAMVYALVWGIDWVRLGFRNDNRYEQWVSIGLTPCVRCGHAKRDHADMRTLTVGKCGCCACISFAER